MPKVFNREVKLAGKDMTINSIAVKVLERDGSNYVLRASGTTVPTGAGYAKGALFTKTDAAAATSGLYENQGTTSSASFKLVGDVGYTTGDGGAVTQITDSTTGVTLSKLCGQITTVALTTAAAAEEVFTVTNTLVAATDVVVVSTTYAGAGTPAVTVKKTVAGAFDIVITNLHAANALNAVVVINFAVIKAVAA